MNYKQYIYNKWYDDSYESNVNWVKTQYEEYGDRVVFADISPRPEEDGFMASVIVKGLPKPEPQPEQHKIQL